MVSAEYLAGFMDGEGHLSLGMIPRKNRSPEYPLRVVVYNSKLQVLEEIQRAWGGTPSSAKRRNPRWKPQGSLIWTDAQAAALLRRVAPHLRVKSTQAWELLRFHAHVRRCSRARDHRGRLLPLDEQEARLRRAFHAYLKRLNARGSQAGDPPRAGAGSRRMWNKDRDKPSPEYLAGLIDAEGSLMIMKGKAKGSWNPQYRPRISVSNTCRPVLEDLQRSYGGILVFQRRAKAGWKDAYQLVWTEGMVDQLLYLVDPYLRLKREQAVILRDFLDHRRHTERVRDGSGFAKFPRRVVEIREGLYRRMKELNARGLNSAGTDASDAA